jgi:hypothetical protein
MICASAVTLSRCAVHHLRATPNHCSLVSLFDRALVKHANTTLSLRQKRETNVVSQLHDRKDGNPLVTAEAWKRSGRDVAIATVIETWGSAPRRVGSHLVVDGDGNFEGSVSGGCVEAAVITASMDVIAESKAVMMEFGVADEAAWRAGLSCGGRIRVYVERLD